MEADMEDRLFKLLLPIEAAVRVNDGDTLARLIKDDHRIWTATGSWSRSATITLGDMRKISRFMREAKDPIFAQNLKRKFDEDLKQWLEELLDGGRHNQTLDETWVEIVKKVEDWRFKVGI